MTDRANHFSQNLPAIEAFTTLFDITAMSIVEAAIINVGFPESDSLAIVCVIASTSARPEISQKA